MAIDETPRDSLGRRCLRKWTEKDDAALLALDYDGLRQQGRLGEVAESFGRTRQFLCRQARRLGLTTYSHKKLHLSVWKHMTREEAIPIWEKFCASRLGLGQFCAAESFDDLGFSRKMRLLFEDEYEAVIEAKSPRQGMYRLGRAVEYRVRDDLRTAGYFVTRSPASKSPVDLVAIRTGEVLMVQCKRSLALGVGEWNELFDLSRSCGAVPILAGSPTGRGTTYLELTGRKDGSKKRQPMKPWAPR